MITSVLYGDPDALLYRAHFLQDMERWSEACRAYEQVNASFFVGPWTWRYELLLEQKAYCLLRSGNIASATTQFSALLDRWTAHPELARDLLGVYVTEAATGVLREQLWGRLSSLVKREGWDWLGPVDDKSDEQD